MIVAFCGVAGSGKDTAADYLVRDKAFTKVALADPIKRICKDVFQFTDEQLWGPSGNRNAPDFRYQRFPDSEVLARDCDAYVLGPSFDSGPQYLTPRYALQQLGTEWGRRCHATVWVDYAMRTAKRLLDHSGGPLRYTPQAALYVPGLWEVPQPVCKGVVISDVRFKNEVEGLKAAGAKVIRILRPEAGLVGTAGLHRSEKEQLEIPDGAFDAVIRNSSTLDALYSEVMKAVGV